jgi:hypothetical protein
MNDVSEIVCPVIKKANISEQVSRSDWLKVNTFEQEIHNIFFLANTIHDKSLTVQCYTKPSN